MVEPAVGGVEARVVALAVGEDLRGVAVDQRDVRVCVERLLDLVERVGGQEVVVVELDQVVAARFRAGAAFGRADAPGLVVDHEPESRLVVVRAPAGAVVEHDHPFPLATGLRPEAVEALVEVLRAVRCGEHADHPVVTLPHVGDSGMSRANGVAGQVLAPFGPQKSSDAVSR